MTPTTPCLTCCADDPVSGAAHGCLACQTVIALATATKAICAIGMTIKEAGEAMEKTRTAFASLDEPTQDDLDALEDGIGTRPSTPELFPFQADVVQHMKKQSRQAFDFEIRLPNDK